MNKSIPPTDAGDGSDAILAQFVQELAEAADPAGVIEKFQAAYPLLADQFPAMAEMMKRVEGSSPSAGTDLPPNLGGFRLVRRIAHGGMGEVFEALEERLQRRVAVKIVHRQHLSPVHHFRFLREQLVLARLHQTHIVPIFAAGEAGPFQYFAMPYIEGAALHHALEVARQPRTTWPGGETPKLSTLVEMCTPSNGQSGLATTPQRIAQPAPAKDAAPAVEPRLSRNYFRSVAEVMSDVADALHHAHTAGIVHRDVKPSNIMIAPDAKSWIIDFGLAGYRNQPGSNGRPPESPDLPADPIAVSGVTGTPQYMAPEQWTNPEQVDARADVWGLGATLYELLTLQPAFKGSSHTEIRTQVLTTSLAPPRRQVRGLSTDLEAICVKALQKQPEQRYQTAREFAEDLRCWLRDEPTQAGRLPALRRAAWLVRQHIGLAAVIMAVVLVVIGLAVGWGVAKSARADAEKARADAAQGEALKEKAEADEARYGALLLELQQSRLLGRIVGWSKEVMKRAKEAAKIRVDDRLRNQAAAALAGLDAVEVETMRVRHGASAVAWDPEGKRLLMGATKNGKASLWDGQRKKETPFEHAGLGPVAFLADGTPVQLVADPVNRWSVVLWDVGKGLRIREFPIPPDGKAEEASDLNPVIAAMTEDGAFVAAATLDVDDEEKVVQGHVAAWDSRTGKLLVTAEAKATALALSPDGAVLAAGDTDGRIRFWSLLEGKELEPLRSDRMAIDCLAFGRNPRRAEMGHAEGPASPWLLATGEHGGTVSVWDLRTRLQKFRFQGSTWSVYTVAFSPDGMTLASAGHGASHLWDVASGRLLLTGWGLDWATSVAFSPNGLQLAVSSDHSVPRHSNVKVYELEPGRGMQSLRGLVGQIAHVRFSPDGRRVAALSHNWQVALWDCKEHRLLHVLDVPIGFFADNADLCFSPDGSRFAFVSGRQAKMWEVASARELGAWDLPPGLVERLAFRTNDELVLFRMETKDKLPPIGHVSWRDPRVCRIRLLAGPKQIKPVAEIHDFNQRVFGAVISPDGGYIVAAGLGGPDGDRRTIRIFEGTNGKEVGILPLDRTDGDQFLCLDATGKLLAYAPANGNPMTLVDVPSGKKRDIFPRGLVSLGPGGNYWVSSGPVDAPGLTLVRRQDDNRLVTVGIDDEVGYCTFNIDGTHWAWGLKDGSVTVCDIPSVQRRMAEIGLGWR